MGNPKRWVARMLAGLAVAMPLAAAGVYLVNPLGARSFDPRQRILGYAPYRVPSRSMAPTIIPEQIVIMRSGYYTRHEPQRGDIVLFLNSEDGNVWIKRVVGLPGETVSIKDGVVLIDGRQLAEQYLLAENTATDYSRTMTEKKVPGDNYFLLGDTRDNSEDARIFGATHRDDLTGKVVAILK